MAGWSIARVWETVARTVPQRTCQIQGQRRLDWAAFESRASALAGAFLATGVSHQAKVALYLYNVPAYMEAAFAALKAALVPVNVNYRYRADELVYLFDNSDAEIVVYHASFDAEVSAIRSRCPRVRAWIRLAEHGATAPDWTQDYEAAATREATIRAADHCGPDDIILIYTGGTTGMPKGVMWRQDDLYLASNTTDDPREADLDAVARRIEMAERFPVGLSAAPLMHGTGFVFATTVLSRGGTLVTQTERRFDVELLLDSIHRNRVTDLCIVGDAFAQPIVDALDAKPDRWDVTSLRAVSSSGMVWSKKAKERLLEHAPDAILIDFLNSSEASGMGRQITSRRKPAKGPSPRSDRFRLGKNAFVIDDAGQPLQPGSDTIGRLAVRGTIPIGYYKDPAKTEATFPIVDGKRCSIPGDLARLDEDGSIILLGRGSTSINTGGEKVFPEEVEGVIKTCPGVRDALVVGLPDPRFGEVVAAVVQASAGPAPEADAIIAHVRERLARHKAPRHVLIVDDIERNVTGKADYPAVRERLMRWLSHQAV